MIDASSFAAQHNAFWADQTPTCEHFVRRLNLEFAKRWTRPLEKPEDRFRVAFVAELAFSRFCAKVARIPDHRIMEHALRDARKRLRPLIDNPASLEEQVSQIEETQALNLEGNLWSFFSCRKTQIVTRPLFHGCGYIDASEGDILSGSCLFEIKSVERSFRSIDIRQLITYCALNHSSGQFEFENIGVFNPRRGLYFELEIDGVSREISGQPKLELFESIIHTISSGEISR